MVRQFLADGADATLPDGRGWTPLHFAAAANNAVAAQLLLGAGAVADAADVDGNTSLFRAVFAYAGDDATIEVLRDAGAEPRRLNRHRQDPVGLARLMATTDVARLFEDVS